MKAPRRRPTDLANTAKRIASDWVAVPNAHAVLVRSCAMNAPRRRSAALASATKSTASDWIVLPKAHAVMASCRAMHAHRHCSTALANANRSAVAFEQSSDDLQPALDETYRVSMHSVWLYVQPEVAYAMDERLRTRWQELFEEAGEGACEISSFSSW